MSTGVILVACLSKSIVVSPYSKALFTNCRICRAISSPYSWSVPGLLSYHPSKLKRRRVIVYMVLQTHREHLHSPMCDTKSVQCSVVLGTTGILCQY